MLRCVCHLTGPTEHFGPVKCYTGSPLEDSCLNGTYTTAATARTLPTPGLRYKIPVFSDTAPGKS